MTLLTSVLLASVAGADNRPPMDIPALHDAQAQDAAIAAIDAQIARGEWRPARDAAAAALARSRTIWHGDLQLALVRLAFLEAKLGEREDALFHWQSLAAMGGADLAAPLFASFGVAAAPLRAQAPRAWDELPAGVVAVTGEVTPPRRIAGDLPAGDGGCSAARGPLWARLQLVVDADGRARQPVIVGPSVCFSLAVLEAARRWTFAPARRGDRAVATLYTDLVHPPAQRALPDVTAGQTTLAPVLALLAAGKLAAAEAPLAERWNATLDAGAPERSLAVALLALRALALAARDDPEAQRRAGCLWEAAQGEEPAFYDVGLAPFGVAGQRLAAHRFGEVRARPIPEAAPGEPRTRPQVLRETRRAPRERFPVAAYSSSRVLVEAIVDEDGTVRDPLLVDRRAGMRGLDLEALDAVCSWRYRPATIGGRAVDALYVLVLDVGAAPPPAPR